ncbi:hypothetical protein [Acidiferrobacter sp.]|uniref:hypothetical protein n=1 Tax=Acidiferrobacter sp. TaxID=1872107 RepID=UPI00261C0134|nr:hypothetical protein [Acidiferrobacter sp.]
MTEDAISTLYRKACPSCARQYARDSRACPFCGYVEVLTSETEEDQERLYGEYLAARQKQAHNEVERLRRAVALHPEDRTRERALALALADEEALAAEWAAYRDGRHQAAHSEPEPPPQIVAAHSEPEPRATPHKGGRHQATHSEPEPPPEIVAAHGEPEPRATHKGGRHQAAHSEPPQRAVADKECPVCTATLPKGVERCACGYVFGAGLVAATTLCPHCTAPVVAGAERCGCGYPLTALAPTSGIPGLRRPRSASE